MNKIDWSAIGAIGTVIGVMVTIAIAIIQSRKKETPTDNDSISQNIKGLFFLKNDISQKIEKRD